MYQLLHHIHIDADRKQKSRFCRHLQIQKCLLSTGRFYYHHFHWQLCHRGDHSEKYQPSKQDKCGQNFLDQLQYRSERMEMDVQNKDGLLASGMYADVILYAKANINTLFVPKSAVVISTERKYVLLSKDNKIKKVDVSTGNETMGKIEVYGDLQAGDKVIVNASDEIRESS